jgi:hypothetical protein
MTVIIQGSQLRALLLGVRVAKPSVMVQNTAVDLFNVTGGLVAVTSLTGVVTTAVANTASLTIKLQHTPTGGSAGDLTAATGVTNDPVATLYGWTFPIAAELISQQSAAGTEAPSPTFTAVLDTPVILPAGLIEMVVSDHDPGTGAVAWRLTYVPVDDGAAVAAA